MIYVHKIVFFSLKYITVLFKCVTFGIHYWMFISLTGCHIGVGPLCLHKKNDREWLMQLGQEREVMSLG